jgi:uncharacterized protein (DUF488 family)
MHSDYLGTGMVHHGCSSEFDVGEGRKFHSRRRDGLAGAPIIANPVFTIGHSTRPLADFVALLKSGEIGIVVDVRTVPRSRTNPQYRRDVLPPSLAEAGIRYEHIAALGGLRGRSSDVSPDVNAFWQNASFHNFADYAMTETFRDGLAQLGSLAKDDRCAVMCSEAVWWRCHRRIIADYLLHAGAAVFHILGPQRVEAARITPAAEPGPEHSLTYPAA